MVSIIVSEELSPMGNGNDGFIVGYLHLVLVCYHGDLAEESAHLCPSCVYDSIFA